MNLLTRKLIAEAGLIAKSRTCLGHCPLFVRCCVVHAAPSGNVGAAGHLPRNEQVRNVRRRRVSLSMLDRLPDRPRYDLTRALAQDAKIEVD